MGALEAILGLGALLGVGYYVISIANKAPISIPFITPPLSVNPPAPPSPPTTPSPPASNPSSSKKQPAEQPILTPTNSEMTSPNVAGTAFTFNVVGDVDETPATATNLCGTSPTLAIFVGDFAYHCNAQKWWTGSMRACNGKNVIGSLGNHDCGGKGFIDLWPANGGKWSFTKQVGNIAFIAVNTGASSSMGGNPANEEPLFKAAQANPSVKWIIAHHHKPMFTKGVGADAPLSLHTMYSKYSKCKMVFAGHNHTYKRYIPIDGIQYITCGQGGHAGNNSNVKGYDSGSIGVAKCRVGTDGGISCQYVANTGQVLDNWGLTADGKHTGSGGVTPDQRKSASATSAYAQSYIASVVGPPSKYADKEDRDDAIIKMLDEYELRINPRRQFNNQIYHYSSIER